MSSELLGDLSNINFKKKRFNKVILSYKLLSDITNLQNEQIENLNDSQLILIYQDEKYNQNKGCNVFVICFEKTIIILDISQKSYFKNILFSNLPICILGDSDKIISDLEIYEYYKDHQITVDSNFNEEINSFTRDLGIKIYEKPGIRQIWNLISPCLIGYLIKKSYFQIDYDRFKNFNEYKKNFSINEDINEDEYVELRIIGTGAVFGVSLVYFIEKGELKAIKKPYYNYDDEVQKLFDREKNL